MPFQEITRPMCIEPTTPTPHSVEPAQQRSEILQADNQPSPEGAEPHHIMDIAWQDRERQADGQIAGEVEHHHRDNAQVKA